MPQPHPTTESPQAEHGKSHWGTVCFMMPHPGIARVCPSNRQDVEPTAVASQPKRVASSHGPTQDDGTHQECHHVPTHYSILPSYWASHRDNPHGLATSTSCSPTTIRPGQRARRPRHSRGMLLPKAIQNAAQHFGRTNGGANSWLGKPKKTIEAKYVWSITAMSPK